MSIWKMALIAIVVGVVFYFTARSFFPHSSDRDWDQISAALPSPAAPQALVHGWTKSPLGEWRYTFLWKAGDDKWLVYEIDPKGAAWDKYLLRKEGESVYIDCNGKVVGVFDPGKGEFNHVREKQVDKSPAAAIHAANLDHEAKWVYWSGSPAGS